MVWRRNALKAYRTLLWAYPSEFRHEYGEEMERLFATRLRVEPPIRLFLESFADVAITAPQEHLEILVDDLRHSMRLLFKRPGFSLITLLTITLGTGSSTMVFSLINAVLFRSLPYGNPGRLLSLFLR